MKIAVIGAGAIGCYLAAQMSRADHEVVLVGRNEETVGKIRAEGLNLISRDGLRSCRPDAATNLKAPPDLVIFATKTQDLEAAYQRQKQYLEECDVLTTQNGVQADNILSCHFEPERMFSSIVMFGVTCLHGGEIEHLFPGPWIIGRPYTSLDLKTHGLVERFNRALPSMVSEDVMGMKWLKLFINFNNCLCALTGKPMQETFADLRMCELSVLLLKEGLDIVADAGIALVSLPDFPKERVEGLARMPLPEAAAMVHQSLTGLSKKPVYGSILQSILRGRDSEIEYINGEVVHLARQMRTTAPLNERAVDLVHGVEGSKIFLTTDQVIEELSIQSQ